MITWCGVFFTCLKGDKKNPTIDLSAIKTIICRKIRFRAYCKDVRAGRGLSHTHTHARVASAGRSQSAVYQMLPSRPVCCRTAKTEAAVFTLTAT